VATPARLAGVGAFVLGGLLLFTVGLFMIGDRQMAFAKKFTIYTEFKKITGLQPGAIVRVSGAKAGSIKQIVPPNGPSGKFRVEMEITEELHPLVRTDSLATIETEGLVGGSYLGVSTGSEKASAASPKSTIPSKEPFEISDLMQRMGDTITKVNQTIDEMQDDLQRAVESIGDTVDNANALIVDVSDDVKKMTVAGARISEDAARISEGLRSGKGTVGKLLNDDELYKRATSVAKEAEEIAANTRQVVEQAKKAIDEFQSKEGPVQGLATNLKQTMDDARTAMAGFAENMEALKHNFLFRGFFNDRGFFRLETISPAEYRQGALTRKGVRRPVRVWLNAAVLFEPDPDRAGAERLTDDGKRRIDSAMATFVDRFPSAALIVEGYWQAGSKDEQYLQSRLRASTVRDYLIGKFQLDPQMTGIMPLGGDSEGSPTGGRWDGIALAVFQEKPASPPKRSTDPTR
jgi:phospholipid/cholesterol/gamma-HCH transport system substrate-binding protein